MFKLIKDFLALHFLALAFGIGFSVGPLNLIWAHDPEDPDVLRSINAAEISLHRIEKLVYTNKLPISFQTNFVSISIETLEQKTPRDPLFKVIARQPIALDGTQKKIEFILDPVGRTQQTYITKAQEIEIAPVQLEVNSLTIAELALHYLLDNVKIRPELDVFVDNLLSLSLSQITTPEGKAKAILEVKAAGSKEKLVIQSAGTGTVESAEIVAEIVKEEMKTNRP
jgi:hypothetical protein